MRVTPTMTQVMLSLASGDRHGYAIMRDVEEFSGGSKRLGPGTLYGTIKRMLASGLVAESDVRPDPALDDQRRRYYRLTEKGRRLLGAEIAEMERTVAIARSRAVRLAAEGAGS